MRVFSKQSISTVSVRIIVMFSGIISSIITAHALGPAGRGELIAITTFGLSVANFANLGFPSSNTYYVSSDINLLTPIFFNSAFISIGGGLLAFVLTLLLYYPEGHFFFLNSIYMFFFVATTMMASFSSNILVSINKIKQYNYLDLLQNISVIFFYILGFFLKLSSAYFLIFGLIGTSIGSIFGIINLNKLLVSKNLRFNLGLFKKSFRYAFKVFITTFVAFFIARGNIFLLQKTHTISEIGYFSIALQLYDAIVIIPSAIGLLLFPQLIKSSGSQRHSNMIKVLKQVALVMFILCLGAFFSIPFLIPLVFGDSFHPSIIIAQLLLPAAFFIGLMGVVSQYLASIGYPIGQVIIWLIAFIIWVILSSLFVPQSGAKGTAIVLTIVNFLTFLLLFILSYKKKRENERAK